jgi:tRNA(adenine34) deaminase
MRHDSTVGDVTQGHFPRDDYFMRLALREAERAAEHDDVPIGCVVVHSDEVIAAAGNERELRQSPTAHAEIVAIEQAARRIGHWRLLDTTMYVTVEPCPMCAGAIVQARIPRLVYGAPDDKAGATGTLFDITNDARLNHRVTVLGGVLADESVALLQAFFGRKR